MIISFYDAKDVQVGWTHDGREITEIVREPDDPDYVTFVYSDGEREKLPWSNNRAYGVP